MMDEHDLITQLRVSNATLRERVRLLEEILSPPVAIPVEWGLSKLQERIYTVLACREKASLDAIRYALYSDRVSDWPNDETLRGLIYRMRQRLKPFGVEIVTFWGTGYGLGVHDNSATPR